MAITRNINRDLEVNMANDIQNKRMSISEREARDADSIKSSESLPDLEANDESPVTFKDLDFTWQQSLRPKYWIYWFIFIALFVCMIYMTVQYGKVMKWLRPAIIKIYLLKWGWVIPILALIVLSFPPLMGQKVVIAICGIIWGLWKGFAIAAAGFFIGEIVTYIAFKTVLRNRALRWEKESVNFAALAQFLTQGKGVWDSELFIVFLIRLSLLPPHYSTAVFAICGVKFWVFFVASLVTLPKQIAIVYIGVIYRNVKEAKMISNVIFVVTVVITIIVAWYVWVKLLRVRNALVKDARMKIERFELRKRRQELLSRSGESENNVTLKMNNNITTVEVRNGRV